MILPSGIVAVAYRRARWLVGPAPTRTTCSASISYFYLEQQRRYPLDKCGFGPVVEDRNVIGGGLVGQAIH